MMRRRICEGLLIADLWRRILFVEKKNCEGLLIIRWLLTFDEFRFSDATRDSLLASFLFKLGTLRWWLRHHRHCVGGNDSQACSLSPPLPYAPHCRGVTDRGECVERWNEWYCIVAKESNNNSRRQHSTV